MIEDLNNDSSIIKGLIYDKS